MVTTRRVFLQAVGVGAGAVCAATLGACGPGPVAAGNVSDLAVGAVKQITGAPVLVGRDADGVYAMTSICTHKQCDMAQYGGVTADHTIRCDCHGSVFAADGSVIRGPAPTALQHWKATVGADGGITVDTSTDATPEERTPVPG